MVQQPHVHKIAMYSLPSDLNFAGNGTLETPQASDTDTSFAIDEGHLRHVNDQMPAVIWTTDLDLSITFSTGNGLAKLSHRVHPFVGMALSEFFEADSDPTPVITAHLKALGGYVQSFEFSRGGEAFLGNVEPLFNDEGNLIGTVGVLIDITERLRQEQERVRMLASRHESDLHKAMSKQTERLGQQFSFLFNGIAGYATIARMGLESDHPMQWSLTEIEKASQCAVDLIDQLLAGQQLPMEDEAARMEPVDLSQLIKNQLQTFQAFLPSSTTLQCDLAPDMAPAAGNAEQLRRLLVNLLYNAASAIGGERGTISVRTQLSSGPPSVMLEQDDGSRLPDGEYVWLQVSDTGAGLSREEATRIFEPRAGFSGQGLGLATAKAIVRRHHGVITVSSKPDLGTTYHVLLPALAREQLLPPENFF